MKVVYTYKDRNKFPHKFQFNGINDEQRVEIYKWIKESGGKYNVDFCYWALANKPAWGEGAEVYFSENDIAMAFKLIWL